MTIGFEFTKLMHEENGQDLVEYTLLLGAIALAGAGTVFAMGGILDAVWITLNGRLVNASN